MRTISAVLIAASLVLNGCDERGAPDASVRDGGDPVDFETAEVTGEAPLSRDQFRERFSSSGVFDQWDFDSDGHLTRQEFARGVARAWDRESDGRITEREWDGAADVWFGTADYGAWYDWDRNDDAGVGREELAAALEEHGLYERWDVDASGAVGENEFLDRWFEIVDENSNGEIESAELEEHIRHFEPGPI